MTISLAGQTVLVIGGAKRIGRAVALECARSGANVAFTFHTSQTEAKATLAELRRLAPDQKFAAFALDVTRADEWVSLAEQVEGAFGRVSGLVFCAAIFKRTPLDELSERDFDAHLAANTKGPFLGCQTFGPKMRDAGGSIVLFSDIYAQKPLANYIPYCVSKAGVEMLAKGFAKALAPRVRVNCLALGAILPGENDEDDVQALIARVPLQRLGSVEEVARAVLFLLAGTEFVSGVVLSLDGGQLLR